MPKLPKMQAKKGPPRPGGVLRFIYDALHASGRTGITKAEMLAGLKRAFPDRAEEGMRITLVAQLTYMPRERGFTLGRSSMGRYVVGLRVRSTARTPAVQPHASRNAAARAIHAALEAGRAARKEARRAA